MQKLGDEDKENILKTIDDEVLEKRNITFRSASVTGGDGHYQVDGELTLAGASRPLTFDLRVDDGAVHAAATVTQTRFGMKPFSALFGTLKVLDDVEVRLDGRLGRLAEGHPEALAEAGERLEVELEAVGGAERGAATRGSAGPRPGRRRRAPRRTSRSRPGDDLEDPARLVAGVPERMPLVARLVDEVAGLGVDDVVAEQRAHPALEHVGVLVLAAVAVQRRGELARAHRVLDEREAAVVGLVGVDHEADADRAEAAGLAVTRADDLRRGAGVHQDLSLNVVFIDRR
jgi:hypothetical protein